MTIKPWLSRNFLQMMTRSNERDYPPKRKKAWLFDNFMEMEELDGGGDGGLGEIPGSPIVAGNPPLPIVIEPEEEDPCAGSRNLWVLANPSNVDCDGGGSFDLIISPDFRCVEITEVFPYEEGPSLVEDEQGNFNIEKGCAPEATNMLIRVCDCLCGGCSVVNVQLEDCTLDSGMWVFESGWFDPYPDCCQAGSVASTECIIGMTRYTETYACGVAADSPCLDTCSNQTVPKCGAPDGCDTESPMYLQQTFRWQCAP